MASLRFIKAGLLTTIQDLGRESYQQYGVPVSGAMDSHALQMANLLVGNNRDSALIEMTLLGPEIEFQSDECIALTGADCNPTINSKPVEMEVTLLVKKGDQLKCNYAKGGIRSYLAIAGVFDIPKVMGSYSTYLRGGFGGYKGRKIIDGDEIQIISNPPVEIRRLPKENESKIKVNNIIRVILGPEDEAFTEKGIETFLSQSYRLTTQSDRMGYRFEGEEIEHKKSADIISAGITLGAIQIPGDGKPIIMMADHQTTGGYTKIANVVSVDIPLLAQMIPGDEIYFQRISINEAHSLIRKQEEDFKRLETFFKKEVLCDQNENKASAVKNYNIRVNNNNYTVTVEEVF